MTRPLTTNLAADCIHVTDHKHTLIARIIYDIEKRDAYGRDETNDGRFIRVEFPELEDEYTRCFMGLSGAEAYVWAIYLDMLATD